MGITIKLNGAVMGIDDVLINLPWQTGFYNVVQLIAFEKPKLLFGYQGNIHGRILSNYLDREKIDYTSFQSYDELGNNLAVPLAIRETYQAIGMGRAVVSQNKKMIALFGSCHEYGLSIDKSHIETMQQLSLDWKITELSR